MLNKYITLGCIILTLTGCVTKPDEIMLSTVKQVVPHEELSLDQALTLHAKTPFKSLNYFPLEHDYLNKDGSRTWHKKGVMNKKTKFISPYQKNALANPLFHTMEYWLIRKAKKHIEENYFRVYGQQPIKKHQFKPHLYGGKNGLGTLFPIIDNDMDSYTNFVTFLENKTQLSDEIKKIVINNCFPQLAFYQFRTKLTAPTARDTTERCIGILRDRNIPFYGLKTKEKEFTRVVETFVVENPTFDAGLYHHLFNTKKETRRYKVKTNHFDSLFLPQKPDYLISLSMDNRYVLDLELAFSDATIVKQIRNELFSAGVSQELLGDHSASDLYGQYDLTLRRKMGYHTPQHHSKYQIFSRCRRGSKTIPVAYEDFTRIDYRCYQGGKPESHKNWTTSFYYPPVSASANVRLTTLNEQDSLLSSYTKVSNAATAYVEIKDLEAKEGFTNRLISKQFHYSFLSWLSVEDNKIYGNVEFYGMLFKYNITDIVKYRLSLAIDHFDTGDKYTTYWAPKGWSETLKLFPDLMAKHQAKITKYE